MAAADNCHMPEPGLELVNSFDAATTPLPPFTRQPTALVSPLLACHLPARPSAIMKPKAKYFAPATPRRTGYCVFGIGLCGSFRDFIKLLRDIESELALVPRFAYLNCKEVGMWLEDNATAQDLDELVSWRKHLLSRLISHADEVQFKSMLRCTISASVMDSL